MDPTFDYPRAVDPQRVGTYPALASAGGGFVWDAVLEYRVWCHPEQGAAEKADGNDDYYSFETYEEALELSEATTGAEEPLALVLQDEYIAEAAPGEHVHVLVPRTTEWPVMFLRRPRRTEHTIANFLSPDAPANRLDILRGVAT